MQTTPTPKTEDSAHVQPPDAHLVVSSEARDQLKEIALGLKVTQREAFDILLATFVDGGDPYLVARNYRERRRKEKL